MTDESQAATSEGTYERRLVKNEVFFREANELLAREPAQRDM